MAEDKGISMAFMALWDHSREELVTVPGETFAERIANALITDNLSKGETDGKTKQ